MASLTVARKCFRLAGGRQMRIALLRGADDSDILAAWLHARRAGDNPCRSHHSQSDSHSAVK